MCNKDIKGTYPISGRTIEINDPILAKIADKKTPANINLRAFFVDFG
jgi:hypothetical protein